MDAQKPQSRLFRPPAWLGFNHDGHDVVPMEQYLKIRKSHNLPEEMATARTHALAAARSMQSLLTFGFLEAATGMQVPESRLLQEVTPRSLVITSEGVQGIMRDWIQRISSTCGGDSSDSAPLEKAQDTLDFALSVLIGLAKEEFSIFNAMGEDAPAMICLIATVGEALVKAKMAFGHFLSQRGFGWTMIWTPHNAKLLREEMSAAGWCPSITAYFTSTMSISSIAYATQCGPLHDQVDHSMCSTESCVSYQVDTANYTPQHTKDCRSLLGRIRGPCHHIYPDSQQVKSIILTSEIPVMSLVHDGQSERGDTLHVQKGGKNNYVAISHIWADGLGSTTEDGLPACQLRRLSGLTSSLGMGTSSFWIDSLCVPCSKIERKRAIGMMASIYAGAKAVLIIDRRLELCLSTDPLPTRILRVLTSGWMRRLWTLQEAVLSKTIYISFKDGIIEFQSLMPRPHDMLLQPHLTDLANELFRLTKRSAHGVFTIGDVSRSLRWRSTSRPGDETLAIASLLGVNPSCLVDLDDGHRMVELICRLQKVPKNILFLSGGKSKIVGFRWLPASFMAAHGGGNSGSMMATNDNDAVVTPTGLEAKYRVLRFNRRAARAGQAWVVKDTKHDMLYRVVDLGTTAPDQGHYDCDMILLPNTISPGSAERCVAVLVLGSSGLREDGSFVVYVAYQRRVLLSSILNSDRKLRGKDESFAIVTLAGRLRVCVT